MTDKTELEVSQRAREAALPILGVGAYKVSEDHPVLQIFARFERNILATRTPDPTPVAANRCPSCGKTKHDNSRFRYTPSEVEFCMDQFHAPVPPAVPDDGLVEALAKGGFMMTETHNVGEHRGRKLVIGFQNPDDADDALGAIALAVKALRSAT